MDTGYCDTVETVSQVATGITGGELAFVLMNATCASASCTLLSVGAIALVFWTVSLASRAAVPRKKP